MENKKCENCYYFKRFGDNRLGDCKRFTHRTYLGIPVTGIVECNHTCKRWRENEKD